VHLWYPSCTRREGKQNCPGRRPLSTAAMRSSDTRYALPPRQTRQPAAGSTNRHCSLDILPTEQEPIPKGLHHSAQGCAPSATLGGRWIGASTLKGLYRLSPSGQSIPHIVVCKGQRCNPFRVNDPAAPAPRVALGAQPWAERYNPFGIVYGVALSADGMSKLQGRFNEPALDADQRHRPHAIALPWFRPHLDTTAGARLSQAQQPPRPDRPLRVLRLRQARSA
jgi:hypothetical protein